MTGESKFRGVIGDYDTGSNVQASILTALVNSLNPNRQSIVDSCSFVLNEKMLVEVLVYWSGKCTQEYNHIQHTIV